VNPICLDDGDSHGVRQLSRIVLVRAGTKRISRHRGASFDGSGRGEPVEPWKGQVSVPTLVAGLPR
jgi:hypothetical protein